MWSTQEPQPCPFRIMAESQKCHGHHATWAVQVRGLWSRHGNKPTTQNQPLTRAVPAPREGPARGRQEITDAQADARKQETREVHGLFLSSAPETKTNS